MANFIQWNIRSIQANREELQVLFCNFNPSVVCLQETLLKDNSNVCFRNYSLYHHPGTENNSTFHSGVAILVKNSIAHKPVPLNTNLQAVAARVSCFKTITICSIYLPPSQNLNLSDLEDLLTQLPPPVLLMGDFNAHNCIWGSKRVDRCGKIIEDLILKQNISILNDGSNTYLHPGTGSLSTIHCLCDPSLYTDLTWSVSDDLCGSDHFPVFISCPNLEPTNCHSTWKLHKADWTGFSDMCSEELGDIGSDLSISVLLPFCMTWLPPLYPETSVNLKVITPHVSVTIADLLFLTGRRLSVRLKPPLLQ